MSGEARRPTVMYMHTIEGKPATWSDGDQQIVYVDVSLHFRDLAKFAATLRKDLRQIRRDQAKTRKNRRAWRFKDDAGKYGYCRIVVPAADPGVSS